MGGFVNGIHERQPGIKLYCNWCGMEKHESAFHFNNSKGYGAQCIICARKKATILREKRKNIGKDALSRHVKTEIDTVPDTISIEELRNRIRCGDEFMASKFETVMIVGIYQGYARVQKQNGRVECLQWDDMLRIWNYDVQHRGKEQ